MLKKYKHDGDGKIYTVVDGVVKWIAEAQIDNACGVVDIMNACHNECKKLKQELRYKEALIVEAMTEARNIRDTAEDEAIKSRLSCFVGKMEFWK